mgnify:CR=1 FL=1
MRRVVVTGLGIVSSLGNNIEEVTTSLRNGNSGITFCKEYEDCLLYTSPSPRDRTRSRMPSSA